MNNVPSLFNFNNNQVRVIEKEGEPWFVATDVCTVLELIPRDSIPRLDDDEKSYVDRTLLGLNPGKSMYIINESGLYSLIMTSRKPSAKKFRKWVTSEVLPAIRKTGGYIPVQEGMSDMEIMARAAVIGQKTIEEMQRKRMIPFQ